MKPFRFASEKLAHLDEAISDGRQMMTSQMALNIVLVGAVAVLTLALISLYHKVSEGE